MGDGKCHIAQPLPAYPRDATRGEREARWAVPNEGKRESFPLNSPPTRAT
jgi:hypothetical protein